MQRITPLITILKKLFRFLKKSSCHCSIVLLSLQQTYAVNTIAMDRHIKALIILIIQSFLCNSCVGTVKFFLGRLTGKGQLVVNSGRIKDA